MHIYKYCLCESSKVFQKYFEVRNLFYSQHCIIKRRKKSLTCYRSDFVFRRITASTLSVIYLHHFIERFLPTIYQSSIYSNKIDRQDDNFFLPRASACRVHDLLLFSVRRRVAKIKNFVNGFRENCKINTNSDRTRYQ